MLRAALPVLIAVALISCDQARPAPQIDRQPPGFEIAGPGGEAYRYPESLQCPTSIKYWATWSQ